MALLANRLAYLRAFVAEPVKQPGLALGEQIWGDRRTRFCYFTAIAFSLCFSLLFYQQAFSAPFVIQDDARQHIFWMRRFLDPELFPNDLIADYFESVAPAGYSLLYRIAALLGFDPILFSKLLPLGLSLIAVSYCFGLSLTIFPLPVAAFSSALLLAQSLCFTDTLVSGIQKAFIYPFVCAFLYYLAQRRWLGTVISLVLLGGFYPQMVLIAAGTLALQLLVWQRQKWGWRLGWTGDRQTWRISLLGLGTAFAVLLPYALGDSGYGPVVSADQARQMPEFFKGGRARYFRDDNPGEYWFGGRSGLRFNSALTPATNALGLVCPCCCAWIAPFPWPASSRPVGAFWSGFCWLRG
ncbi:MAG: hypothetical protein HC824_06635 [Synechococcales cyanobacterium RM1_1_8]|nr:hypothetical protein [Synechococcales cyanobacterium RM1_1_8]